MLVNAHTNAYKLTEYLFPVCVATHLLTRRMQIKFTVTRQYLTTGKAFVRRGVTRDPRAIVSNNGGDWKGGQDAPPFIFL
jgi:hypothetical protein